MRLDGKVALISGAAHGVQGELMGFGGASAWLFVREGAKVVLGDINEEDGARTAAQIRESGGEALFVRLDVTREEDWSTPSIRPSTSSGSWTSWSTTPVPVHIKALRRLQRRSGTA